MLFSGDSGVPLIRYHIADQGGLVSSTDMQDYCARHGFTPDFDNNLPFVFVFGRSLFAVSFFGANVYPENVTVGLEQPAISDWVTGKFVLEKVTDEDQNTRLRVTVELASDRTGDADMVADSICNQLLRLNNEYAHYVPAEYQLPQVILRPAGDPEYFPVGVKHRYTRQHQAGRPVGGHRWLMTGHWLAWCRVPSGSVAMAEWSQPRPWRKSR